MNGITLYITLTFSSLFVSSAFQVPGGTAVEPMINTAIVSDSFGRRQLITSLLPSAIAGVTLLSPQLSFAGDGDQVDPVIVSPTGEIKKLFNEGRALEQQGNIQASQRIFAKVTKLEPRVRLFCKYGDQGTAKYRYFYKKIALIIATINCFEHPVYLRMGIFRKLASGVRKSRSCREFIYKSSQFMCRESKRRGKIWNSKM